jgi:hypothetical protein
MLLQDRNDSECERVSCGIDNRSVFSCLFSFGFRSFVLLQTLVARGMNILPRYQSLGATTYIEKRARTLLHCHSYQSLEL